MLSGEHIQFLAFAQYPISYSHDVAIDCCLIPLFDKWFNGSSVFLKFCGS